MEVRVLGTLQVERNGAEIEFGPKERLVVARLALGRGGTVSDDALIDALWGDSPPPSARATLQGYVHRLRDKLGAEVIVRSSAGYRLSLPPARLDLLAVEHDAQLGRRAVAEARHEEAAERFRHALAQFRGTPFVELGENDAAVGERRRVEEVRRCLTEELIDVDLARGRHTEWIPELEVLLADDPTRERLWGQLMVALVRSGRQADALEAYSRARRVLARELGIEPSAHLRQLERAVLEQRPDVLAPTFGSSNAVSLADDGVTRLPQGVVTFLFTDVVASTELLQVLGPEWPAALEAQHETIRLAATEWAGVELGTDGDAVKLVFAKASDAVAAAIAIQTSLATRAWPGGHQLRVRIGIHTGEVQVHDGHHVGLAPHVAARVTAAGHGGQVLITDATRALIADVVTLDVGLHRLRDLPEPVHLHQVVVPGQTAVHPPLATAASPTNLPAEVDDFIGREDELAAIGQALEAHRLITLTGTGGSGKTRLALRTAAQRIARHRDGVWLVELAPVVEPAGLSDAIARAVGAKELPGRGAAESTQRWLRERQVLLVLDNCEHVLEEAAAFAADTLRSSPEVRILATSRERLGVRGEHVVSVGPLTLPGPDGDPLTSDAVRLFLARAEAASGPLELDHGTSLLVLTACRRLDGLPLAMEIAAGHLRSLSLADLVTRLDERFRLEATGHRDLHPRQRTLGAVVGSSYDLLSEQERALFRRVSIFPDGFDLAAAEAIGAGPPVIAGSELAIVSHLVEASLLLTSRGPTSSLRYRMLETLRQFASDRLASSGEVDAVQAGLLAWALRRVEQVEQALRTPRQDAALAEAARERLNLRAAFDAAVAAGDPLSALRIAAAVPLSPDHERRQVLTQLLSEVPTAPPDVQARARATLANLCIDLGDAAATIAEASAFLAAAREAGDAGEQAWARYFLLHGHWAAGHQAESQRLADECLTDFDRLGIAHGSAYIRWFAALVTPDDNEAARLATEAEHAFRQMDMPSGLAHALEARALVSLRVGDLEVTRDALVEAITLGSASGNLGCTAHYLEAVAAFAADCGHLSEAAELVGIADALRADSGQGHRVWERVGHDRVLATLNRHGVPLTRPSAPPTLLDATKVALDVLNRGVGRHET